MKTEKNYSSQLREWPQRIYNFNRNSERVSVFKTKRLNKIVKAYFNLNLSERKVRKRKRMQDILEKASSNRLFVSRSDVKQGLDHVNITLYTLDRRNLNSFKSLYTLNQSLLKIDKYSVNRSRENYLDLNKKLLLRKGESKPFSKEREKILKKRVFLLSTKTSKSLLKSSKLLRKPLSPRRRKKFGYFVLKEALRKRKLNLFRNTKELLPFSFHKDKISYVNMISHFFFLKWLLSGLNYNIKKTNKNFFLDYKGKQVIIGKESKNDLLALNAKLFTLIYSMFTRKYGLTMRGLKSRMNHFYDTFKANYMKNIFKKSLLKESLLVNGLYKTCLTNMKLFNLVNNFKNVLKQIYPKKIYLNIIKVKYPHLNIDVLMDSIIVKLSNKRNRLPRVVNLALKQATLPRKSLKLEKSEVLNTKMRNYMNLIIQKRLDINYLNRNSIQSKTYNLSKIDKENNIYTEHTYKGVLENLKHKWVSGLTIQTKGRLTSKYKAERALYMYKTKGTMRDLRSLRERISLLKYDNTLKILAKSPKTPLLRGESIPNTLLRKGKGVRRVGSFGVKLWLNSN